jgi:hypothetical protein
MPGRRRLRSFRAIGRGRRPHRLPSPATVVSLLALAIAFAGPAGAAPRAFVAKLTADKVKKLADAVIATKAPTLEVKHADTADHATTADSAAKADSVTKVETAAHADTATTAAQAATADSAPPNGSAGGSLTGSYPAPSLAAAGVTTTALADGAVTGAKLTDNIVTAAKLAPGAVTTPKLGDHAVGAQQIAGGAVTASKLVDGEVQASQLTDGSVGPSQLAPTTIVVGDSVAIAKDQSKEATVTCPDGTRLLYTSFSIDGVVATDAQQYVIYVGPSFVDTTGRVGIVRIANEAAYTVTLYPGAICLTG